MNQEISREEERILASNADVTIALEDLYSWRYKDRTSRTSKLSHAESWRFQRTLYRISLLSYLYGMGSISRAEDYRDADTQLERNIKKQKEFLETFSSQELLQIRYVAIFLQGIAGCADREFLGSLDVYDFQGIYLFAGPRALLRCHEEGTASPLRIGEVLGDDGPGNGFLTKPLGGILKERRIDIHQAPFEKTILNQINGENDKCSHCKSAYECVPGMNSGVNLWNETNWDYLRSRIYLHECVHQSLANNQIEKVSAALGPAGTDTFRFMHQMFDSKREPYAQWAKTDWVCFSCIEVFLIDTIPFWLLDRKRGEGSTISPDCPSGDSCSLQEGKKHARQFNHLCRPIATAHNLSRG